MAKQVDSLAKILKKLQALQAKASKLNGEISDLSAFVASESKKASVGIPVGKAPAKKPAVKAAPKKAKKQTFGTVVKKSGK